MTEKLKPCPLCGNPDIEDRKYGISCRRCGLWLGDGTSVSEFGGYKMLWNMRKESEET